jgi:hypothetical protein
MLKLKGNVWIYEAEIKGGELSKGELIHERHNLITTAGRERAAALLIGVSTDYLTTISIGDGGTPEADLDTPIVPTLSDTTLNHWLAEDNSITTGVVGQALTATASFFTSASYTWRNPVQKVVNEFGLETSDNVLFAHNTQPSIPFDVTDRLGIIVQWEISVL